MALDFPAMLKELQLKVTPKRVAILEILARTGSFLSPEEVRRKLQEQFARIGLPTVYRNLDELAAGGIIAKIIHPNRQLYYYLCPNSDHHHHFVCLSCHRVLDLEICSITGLEDEINAQVKGKVISHILQVNGLCASCHAREEKGGKDRQTGTAGAGAQ
ncbi:MAG TPA: Fur family transcriptional regulator [Geobacteraceae bacterium]|nr:Fur family transcriptional regulator [Geobacteraceae bacterium]